MKTEEPVLGAGRCLVLFYNGKATQGTIHTCKGFPSVLSQNWYMLVMSPLYSFDSWTHSWACSPDPTLSWADKHQRLDSSTWAHLTWVTGELCFLAVDSCPILVPVTDTAQQVLRGMLTQVVSLEKWAAPRLCADPFPLSFLPSHL